MRTMRKINKPIKFFGLSSGQFAIFMLLTAIIIRIIYVGIKSGNYMNRLICVGIAGMLTAQVFINIGVCIGLVPVIGLTLPFFSYGGTALLMQLFEAGVVLAVSRQNDNKLL